MKTWCSVIAVTMLGFESRSCAAVLRTKGDQAPDSTNAISKVVTLLQDMKARLEEEQKTEQAMFDEYACWCEETTQKSAAAITNGKIAVSATGNTILQLKGTVAVTVHETQALLGEVRQNEETQQMSTTLRQKENQAFQVESQELKQAITALEQAVQILQGAGVAFLNQDRVATLEAVAGVALKNLPTTAQADASRALKSLSTLKTSSTYAPQSATVQGILKDMYKTFSESLESRTHQEAQAHSNFENLIFQLQTQLQLLQDSLLKKARTKSEAEAMLADALQNYEDFTAQVDADIALFDATKGSCQAKAEQWQERSKLHSDELAGITQALTLLSSDSARELFAKAIKPGFQLLQVSTKVHHRKSEEQAYKSLVAAARHGNSLRLAALAADIQEAAGSGHFDAVMKAIDLLLTQLTNEEQQDKTQNDECTRQLQSVALKKEVLSWQLENNAARLTKLNAEKASAIADRDEVAGRLNDLSKQITDMKAQRNDSNQQYLQAKTDDESAVALLNEAMKALIAYYDENGINITLLGLVHSNGTAPDATFAKTDDHKLEAKGIVSILKIVVTDLEREIAAAKVFEASEQIDFEKRLTLAEGLVMDLTTLHTNLETAIALKDQEILSETSRESENQGSLKTETETESNLKPSCDWLATHIEERRQKRAAESDGLKAAKEYLAGAWPQSTSTVLLGQVALTEAERQHKTQLRRGALPR